jgi:endonuclease/exonuclease/phosphatase family metal-dependent hydrolase
MCLNGWGGKLYEDLRRFVGETSPDVLCLQEVVHTPAAMNETLIYRDGDHVLLQRANFFRDVCAVLPEHTAFFCPAARGVLWDGDRAIPSYWGLATFVRADFPVIEQAQGFVHKSFSADGYGEHPRSRNAHAIHLYDYEKGWPVTIAHMHGLRDLRGKMDTPDRLQQARNLARLVGLVGQPQDRRVVCGDFNVEPDSQTFQILGKLGLHDLVTGRGFSGTRSSHYEKPGRFADYMMVSSVLDVVSFNVPTSPEVSDHRPLLLEI